MTILVEPRRRWFWPAWLTLCLLAVVWQPMRLGFYVDDWPQIVLQVKHAPLFSGNLFRSVYEMDTSRPVMAPSRFLSSSLLGDSPWLWQTGLLLSNLLVVWMLAKFGLAIQERSPTRQAVLASVGLAACWLLFPWNAACQFWPSLLPLNILIAVFAGIGCLLIRGWRSGRGWMPDAAVLYLLVCLGYEAFYFQFIPLICVGILLALRGEAEKKAVFKTAFTLITMQGLAVFWYWFSKTTGVQRPVTSRWAERLWSNFGLMRGQIGQSATEVSIPFAAGVVILAGLGGLRLLRARPEGMLRWRQVAVLAMTASAGISLSVLAFSLGNRPLLSTGVESRTYSLLSFWLVVFVVATAGIWRTVPYQPALARWMASIGLLCGTLLVWAHVLRAGDWATGWDLQKKVLSQAPVSAIRQTERDSTIVYVATREVNGASIFSSSWDLFWAMPLTFGDSVARNYVVYSPWTGSMSWDGRRLAYEGIELLPAPTHLYIWKPSESRFERAAAPFRIGQDLSITPLPR